MANLSRFTDFLVNLDTHNFFRDMENLATGQDGLTTLVADAGSSAAVGNGANGICALGTGATDNNEAMVRSTNALFLPVANREIYARASLQFTEAATNAANVFFGLASSAGADLLVDNGAGPRTSGTVVGIYKVDGGTVWRCVTRNGTTVTDTASTVTAGGSAYATLEVILKDAQNGNMAVTFKVNGNYLKDANGLNIVHVLPVSGATVANIAAYVKAGSSSAETLNVDYLYGQQSR